LWNCEGIKIRTNVSLDIFHIAVGLLYFVAHVPKEGLAQIRVLETDISGCSDMRWKSTIGADVESDLEKFDRFK
jgi:hypothetical protein